MTIICPAARARAVTIICPAARAHDGGNSFTSLARLDLGSGPGAKRPQTKSDQLGLRELREFRDISGVEGGGREGEARREEGRGREVGGN